MREATEEIEKCILVLYSSFDLKNVDFFCFYAPLLGRVIEDVLNRTADKENKQIKVIEILKKLYYNVDVSEKGSTSQGRET